MTTKKASEDAAAGATTAPARHVRYVISRPYSAGEAPEVVTARVTREHNADANVLDLAIPPGRRGVKPVEVTGARRSERQEPGTWFEEGE